MEQPVQSLGDIDRMVRQCHQAIAEAASRGICDPAIRAQQKCAPACWNAEGFHCECSCMSENHGGGHPGGSWYKVSETFAVSWGAQRYSCRHLKIKGASPSARLDGN